MAKIVALGEKQVFLFSFNIADVAGISIDLSVDDIVASLGEFLNQDQLSEAGLQGLSAPLLCFLRESQAYKAALKDPSKDGFILVVFREPNKGKKRVYRANWLGCMPASVLERNPVNMVVNIIKQSKGGFDPSSFHRKSRIHEILAS